MADKPRGEQTLRDTCPCSVWVLVVSCGPPKAGQLQSDNALTSTFLHKDTHWHTHHSQHSGYRLWLGRSSERVAGGWGQGGLSKRYNNCPGPGPPTADRRPSPVLSRHCCDSMGIMYTWRNSVLYSFFVENYFLEGSLLVESRF